MAIWLPRGYRAVTELEVRRSRFLTTLARVDDEEAARAVIAEVRRTYPDARHHCTAFIVESADARPIERSSDDGEPAGTAGMPMLEVLRGAGVSQVVAVVTRYFGGILLGTGGLVRAYSQGVADALARAPRVRPVRRDLVRVRVPPADAGRIQAALLNRGVDVVAADWSTEVVLTLAVPDAVAAQEVVRGVLRADTTLEAAGTTLTEVPQNP